MKNFRSPCQRPECVGKNRMLCADSCPELARYQRFLDKNYDRFMAQRSSFKMTFKIDEQIIRLIEQE